MRIMSDMAANARDYDPRRVPAARMVFGELALALVKLSGITLASIGLSGVLAAAMGATMGRSFVSGDTPGVTYSKSRCAEYLEYEPQARTCEQAATYHHFGEIVGYRIAAGVLGLGVMASDLLWLRRRLRPSRLLPESFVSTAGTALFGVPAILFLGQGVSQMLVGQRSGAGAYLSAGIVSLAVAGIYAASLFRTLLHRTPTML